MPGLVKTRKKAVRTLGSGRAEGVFSFAHRWKSGRAEAETLVCNPGASGLNWPCSTLIVALAAGVLVGAPLAPAQQPAGVPGEAPISLMINRVLPGAGLC